MRLNSFKTVYRIRTAFAANFILFFVSLLVLSFSAYSGDYDLYFFAERFFAFHLSAMILSLLLLRFLPNPDLVDNSPDK